MEEDIKLKYLQLQMQYLTLQEGMIQLQKEKLEMLIAQHYLETRGADEAAPIN